jgi:hypothetical protein
MNSKHISTLIGTGMLAAALSAIAQPADAFIIGNTSASWDNVTLTTGGVVGSDGAAPDANNLVNFLEVNGQSQVRWGAAVNGGYWKDNWVSVTKPVQVQKTRQVQVPTYDRRGRVTGYRTVTQTYTVTENRTVQENQKVWVPPTYENQSGLGFKGVTNLDLDVGEIFNLGTLTHFNQTIWSHKPIGESAEFTLNLDFGDNSIGSQQFNFAFSVDETLNNQTVCPYQTTAGKGCSDKIAWNFAIDKKSTFDYNNETYSLELVGFGNQLASGGIVNEFISQENGNNSASLFARLIKVDTTRDIPEPGSLLGLAGLGLYFARARKQSTELNA